MMRQKSRLRPLIGLLQGGVVLSPLSLGPGADLRLQPALCAPSLSGWDLRRSVYCPGGGWFGSPDGLHPMEQERDLEQGVVSVWKSRCKGKRELVVRM
jgi:hypothetical protein